MVSLVMLGMASAAMASFGTSQDARQILREQRQIQEQVEDPLGKYSRFSPEATARLNAVQARIFNLLGGASTVDHLDKNQKVALFNALQEVQAILADNEDDRLVCTRGHKLGSTIKETRCATVAQRRELRDGARLYMEKPGACQLGDGSDYCGGSVIEQPGGRWTP
ncbi:hypothetical protein GCM10023332_06990 [Luteimonas vadosa]|uniref:Uncharacterized protein n=2 Tax=Luteimonas vadosa TaxID=1165507 RepID=A0ABP9DRQ1_9GAMM